MISILASALSLGIALILQTTLFAQVKLFFGTADLVMLVLLAWVMHEHTEDHWLWGFIAGIFVGVASELPLWLCIGMYLSVVGLIHFIQSRIWQAPLVIIFSGTILSSLLLLIIPLIYLLVIGVSIPIPEALNLIVLPGLLLNLLFILPVSAVMNEVAKLVLRTGSDQ